MNKFPFQPSDDAGPVFNEPWEAQAFAMVLALHGQGVFTWNEWAAVLSAEISKAQANGDPDLGNTYYRHWLAALEQLMATKQLTTGSEILAKMDDWREAYLSTPHGEPVELSSN